MSCSLKIGRWVILNVSSCPETFRKLFCILFLGKVLDDSPYEPAASSSPARTPKAFRVKPRPMKDQQHLAFLTWKSEAPSLCQDFEMPFLPGIMFICTGSETEIPKRWYWKPKASIILTIQTGRLPRQLVANMSYIKMGPSSQPQSQPASQVTSDYE